MQFCKRVLGNTMGKINTQNKINDQRYKIGCWPPWRQKVEKWCYFRGKKLQLGSSFQAESTIILGGCLASRGAAQVMILQIPKNFSQTKTFQSQLFSGKQTLERKFFPCSVSNTSSIMVHFLGSYVFTRVFAFQAATCPPSCVCVPYPQMYEKT